MVGQLRFRRSRAAALGAGILVASAGFVLLSAAGRTTDIRVTGSVESNFRTAYDILVRPQGSMTPLERAQRLVRPNYLSGIFGGITLEQYELIKRIRGIDVAAPVANIGYVLPFASVPIVIDNLLTQDPVQLYRVRFDFVGQNGASRYPAGEGYLYYTRRNPFFTGSVELPPDGRELRVCDAFALGRLGISDPDEAFYAKNFKGKAGPFMPTSYLSCFSALSPGNGSDGNPGMLRGKVTSERTLHFPMLVAAIDPVQEAQLLDLDEAIVSGRYLKPREKFRLRPLYNPPSSFRAIPVIASTRTYVDERLEVRIERLRVPNGTNVPEILATSRAFGFVTKLPGVPIERRLIRPSVFYERLLRGGSGKVWRQVLPGNLYWTPSDVAYRRRTGQLSPVPVSNPISIWEDPAFPNSGGYYPAPPSNEDVQFRRLRVHTGSNLLTSNVWDTPRLEVVGRYDPARLPGFSTLSRVPLETYEPPLLEPADAASRRALGRKPLLPTQNVGDYVQQPPLLLTTLEGMKPFLNPKWFKNVSPRVRRAPIGVIRIKVAGVTGPDELSMERIRTVAIAIREQTGLDVDITAGSSPQPTLIDLPAGKFGRPELLLREGWSKKGVSVSFLKALDQKRLGLLALILVTSGFFLGNGAYAAVRARRREIGTLLTLGWSPRAIFAVVLGELALLGLAAGLAGAVLAAAVATAFSLSLEPTQALLVVPLAVGLALAAGLVPAWRAARCVPLDAVLPVVAGRLHGRPVRGFVTLALANVRRLPARSLVAASGLFVGVAALTLLVAINRSFQGTLVGTLLGEAVSLRVRGLDFLTVGLVIGLASLSLADVLFLNLRERGPELASLRTFGWADRHLAFLLALEALALGMGGSLVGAAAGVVLGASLGVPSASLAIAAAVAACGGTAVAVAASLVPLSRIRALTPATILAEE